MYGTDTVASDSFLVSVCPIQLSLIDASLLSPSEKNWLNAYHQECLEKLSPLVEGKAKAWLEKSCVPLA
jgi:Xaa-Pro aminopeptidase